MQPEKTFAAAMAAIIGAISISPISANAQNSDSAGFVLNPPNTDTSSLTAHGSHTSHSSHSSHSSSRW